MLDYMCATGSHALSVRNTGLGVSEMAKTETWKINSHTRVCDKNVLQTRGMGGEIVYPCIQNPTWACVRTPVRPVGIYFLFLEKWP
jgi:nitrous oxide reductase accessory protein NosL